MNTNEWYVIESGSDKTVEMRAWQAGDGLMCSSRTARSKVSCGPPIAVLKTRTTTSRSWSARDPQYQIRNYLMCEHHVANTLSGAGYKVPGITTEADKEAREAVLAAHWDEYQDELARRVIQKRDEQLAKLPDSLRQAILATSTEDQP